MEQLFSKARIESPETTFELTKKQFMASLVLAAGGVLATKGILQLFTKKWIIMTTISLIATVGVVATAVYFSDTTAQEQFSDQPNSNELALMSADDENKVEVPFQDASEVMTSEGMQDVSPLRYSPVHQVERQQSRENSLLASYDDTLKDKSKDRVKIKAYGQRFEITRRTKKADLEQIKNDAIAAGIIFSYEVEYVDDLITVFSMDMELESEGDNQHMTQAIMFDEDDDPDDAWVVEWKTDEDGKAIRVGASDDPNFDFEDYMNDFELGMQEFEIGMQAFEIEMAELENIRFDSPEDSVNYQEFMQSFSVWGDSFELNLPSMDGFEFDFTELEESLKVLENLNEEILEELNVHLELLQLELEEMHKELDKERDEKDEKGERDEKDEDNEKDERGERKERDRKHKERH